MTERLVGTDHTHLGGLVDVDVRTTQQHLHYILVALQTRPEEGCPSILCETWRHPQSAPTITHTGG